jgi:hypothetical protein
MALVVSEPVAPADIIVVSLDSTGAGALEADLVQSGIATRVAVFADPPSGEDHEFIRRGLPYDDASARQIRQLKWLGVMDIVEIPRTEAGTEGEGQVLPLGCNQHQFRSIVFVAGRDHSRRVRRVLDRVMKGRHVSRFNPRATQVLTRTDGGKRAAASGQKSLSSRSSCSRSFCIQCHFDIEPFEGMRLVERIAIIGLVANQLLDAGQQAQHSSPGAVGDVAGRQNDHPRAA